MGSHCATFDGGYRTTVIYNAIVDPMETKKILILHIDFSIARRIPRLAFTLLTGEIR